MPASSKYDMASSSPNRFGYLNGPRGSYTTASLEKSGSFREGLENRTTSSLAGMPRPNQASSQGDVSGLFKSLLSDLKPGVLDQKSPRSGEVKRHISNITGITSEDCLLTTFSMRALPSSSLEEIRRLRSNLCENSLKARDRAKALSEATSKIDKYFHSLSRKHSRADNSPSERSNAFLTGGITSRPGPQAHLTANVLEGGPQKLEERVKSGVTSRRVRTARVDPRMDECANGISRLSGPVQRDKEVFKLVNGGATLLEDTGRALLTVVDGWEKSKMKRKRSVIKSDSSANSALARPLESDREPKRGIQQKPISDARSRLNNTHGFRSGPVAAAAGAGKMDSTSQQNDLGTLPFPRNDQDSFSLPNDRRDCPVSLDKDGTTLKASGKSKCREDNSAASPTMVAQVNGSARGSRSNSGSLLKSSPNVHRVMRSSDDWEHTEGVNKLNATVGVIKRKSSMPTCSPSPPVAQWGGQRPQKITRVARRSNLLPIVSGCDEISTSNVDTVANINDGAFTRRLSYSAPQQSKLKSEHVQSSGLSENEESGASDSKDKGYKFGEIENRVRPAIQKVATSILTSRKNKMAVDEDLGDGFQKQGRSGRSFNHKRSGMPGASDKLENSQWSTGKNGFEKIERKPGRPRVAHIHPRQLQNNDFTVFAGESNDEEKELLDAANASSDTRNACCSLSSEQKEPSLWEQIELVFRFLTAEDIAFLNEQIHFDEAAASTCFCVDHQNLKGDHKFLSLSSTPALDSRRDCSIVSKGNILDECCWDSGISKTAEPFLEQLVRGSGVPNGVSICQALLSAIIEEEEIVTLNYTNNDGEEHLFDDTYGICFEFDEELMSKGSDLSLLGTYHAPERVSSNGYKINTGPGYLAELTYDKMGRNGALLGPCGEGHTADAFLCNRTMASISACSKFQYNQMCTDDRILLELSELGLYPEPVPDLAQSEEEEIHKGINLLEKQLHEQVIKKRSLLSKLENAVMEAKQNQQREIDRISLDKLVGEAYKRYMVCWGPKAVCSKNVTKAMKHAVLSYVRITIALYQKFEVTGGSCFDDPAFQDMFLSVFSCLSNAEEIVEDGEAANCLALSLNSETVSSDHDICYPSQRVGRVDILGKYSDASQSVNHLSQMFNKEDPWTNKVKKRELLLDDVVGSSAAISLRDPSSLGSHFLTGAKGKRSEREGKRKNRGAASKNGTVKIGQPALSTVKGERKNRTKTKQRIAHLSASVNGLLNKPTEVSSTIILSSAPKSLETDFGGNTKKDDLGMLSNQIGTQDVQNDAEAIDLSSLQLPELDGDFGGQGQDIGSWLNIEDDGVQDLDFMGLDIPMDDLSEVNMMI